MPHHPIVSFEFFPPKTPQGDTLFWQNFSRLKELKPEYVSVTYGAGGTTHERTYAIIKQIKESGAIPPAAHLTCVNATREEIDAVAQSYLDIGVNKIVALRGDPPGMAGEYVPHPGGYPYADALVAGLRKLGDFDISVAAYPEGHPQALSLEKDIEHLKRKVDAGADRAITQYCFDTDTILRFIEKARRAGVEVPIVPGIVTISNFAQIKRFSGLCGASIPKWLEESFAGLDEQPEKRHARAVQVAEEQCRVLMQAGISTFHFYTLNHADVTVDVCRALGVR